MLFELLLSLLLLLHILLHKGVPQSTGACLIWCQQLEVMLLSACAVMHKQSLAVMKVVIL